MFDLRATLPASAPIVRAWLTSLVSRITPLWPDPEGFGQPQISHRFFHTDMTLRPQYCPPEIEQAGGFIVGLEVAMPRPDGFIQPMGPVVTFVVTPMGTERSEVRIFFPLGLQWESRPTVAKAVREDWPGVTLLGDDMPFWAVRDFNRRALFEAIAADGPLPPGAPQPRLRTDPLPWRGTDSRPRQPSVSDSVDAHLSNQDREILRLWTEKELPAEAIGSLIGRTGKTVLNRLSALRKDLGEDRVPLRLQPRSDNPLR